MDVALMLKLIRSFRSEYDGFDEIVDQTDLCWVVENNNVYFDDKQNFDRDDCVCEETHSMHRGKEYTQISYSNNGTSFSGVFSNAKEVKEFERDY